METCSWILVSAALDLVNVFLYPLGRNLEGLESRSGGSNGDKNAFTVEINPQHKKKSVKNTDLSFYRKVNFISDVMRPVHLIPVYRPMHQGQ